MATTVDTLLVRIEADMKDIRRDLNRLEQTTKKSTDKMNSSFSKVGQVFKVAMVGVVVRQAAQAAIALTKLASGVEEMQAKSSVVFGKFTDDFRDFTSELAKETGRSRFELEEMGSTVQDTFVPMGFARKEATELSKQLTKLAVDVASFNNKADAEVMRAFQSALVGNHETMRQFGVVITEATLKQELLNMGVKGGTKAASNAEKVQARLNLIFAGTTDAQGDAVRTANSYANRVREMQAALNDLGVEIGTALMPHMKRLVVATTELAIETSGFLKNIGLIADTDLDKLSRLEKQILAIKNAMTMDGRTDTSFMDAFAAGETFSEKALMALFQVLSDRGGIGRLADKATEALGLEKGETTEQTFQQVLLQVLKEQAKQVEERLKLEKKITEEQKIQAVNSKISSQQKNIFLDKERALQEELNKKATELSKNMPDARSRNKLTDRARRELEEARGIIAATKASGINPQGMPFTPTAEMIARNKEFFSMQGAAAGDRLQGQGMPFTPLTPINPPRVDLGDMADARTRNKLTARARREFQQMRDVIAAESTKGINRQGATFTPSITEREKKIIQRDKINLLKEEIEQTMKLETAVFNMTVQNGEYGKNELFGARIQQKMHELRKKDIEMTHGQSHAIALLLVKQEDLRASQAAQVAVFEAFKDRIKQVGDQLADSLAQAFMDGKLELSSFGNIFRSFIQDMIAQVIKLQVIAPIFKSLFGNNTTGGHFLGSLLRTQASGGTLTPNRPHLVGERGAELFVPSGAGTLLNNMNTKNAMSGASTIVNQSINLSTGVAQTVHAEVLNLLPAIKEQTMMAVSDSKRRGGAFAQVMG